MGLGREDAVILDQDFVFSAAKAGCDQSKAWHPQSVHCSPSSIDLNREPGGMDTIKHLSAFDASHI